MGAYLSAPVTDKESIDEQCNEFNYGASSMQGWRSSQEDAHNCIPEFDKDSNTSFFAVYDGHGGPEVAKYCELHFPDFVKKAVTANQKEDLADIIQSAFLDFDATLVEEDVVKTLNELAGRDDGNEEEEDADDPVGRTETDMLKAEADMPLEELLAKYKTSPDIEEEKNRAKKIFFQSPALKAKAKKEEEGNETESAASSSSLPNGATNGEEKEEEGGSSSLAENTENGTAACQESGGEQDVNFNSSSSQDVPGASGSGSSSADCEAGGSGSGQQTTMRKAASDVATSDDTVSSSDDEDEDEEEEYEILYEDDSSEDDEDEEDDEEEEDEDVPLMDMTNEESGSDSGCTACVLLKQGKRLIVANAGDSRCVLARSGVAVDLSFDHKPEDDPERQRIEKAGGKVTIDGRVNGGLNLSRAIGDHVYKKNKDLSAKEQMITALPDIKTAELCDKDQFIVIACDGIWNYMSSQEVVDYVTEKLKDKEKCKKPSIICEELFDHCLAPNILGDGTGCDNMTCIIIVLHPSQTVTTVRESDLDLNSKKRKASEDDSDSECKEPASKRVNEEKAAEEV